MNEAAPFSPTMSQGVPLLRAQESVWIAGKLAPSGTSYSVGFYTELRGPIDQVIFRQAASRAVAETETLRLRFEESETGLVQHVVPLADWSLPLVDLSRHQSPNLAARAWMSERFSVPFDCARAPLFFWALIKLSDDCFYWLHMGHHIILDAYSFHLIARRLSEVYGELLSCQAPSRPSAGSLAALVAEEERYRVSSNWLK